MNGHVIAIVDLGTNSVRLLIVRINPNKSYTFLARHKEMVRLGEGEFSENRLAGGAISRTLGALELIAGMCRDYGVEEIIAVATAAVRDAENGDEFIETVRKRTGIELKIIPGLEEARLIFLGVASGLPIGAKRAAFVDIGGGSTELTVGTQSEYLHLDSLKLGCVRMSMLFPESSGVISQDGYRRMVEYVKSHSLRSIQKIRALGPSIMVGSSGTIENLAEIAAKLCKGGDKDRLTLKNLAETAKFLCSMGSDERRKVPGINPQRAEVIIGGAAVIHSLMESLSMREVEVSNRGLLDGMLLDYLSRGKWGYLDGQISVREQSVFQLARSCGFMETHARHVARLATELFDSGREVGLHREDTDARELLFYSGLLHDIGMFLSFSNHHAHSHYLIRNAELLGFHKREIEMIAMIAFLHRKSATKKNPLYAALDDKARETARIDGMFLRMAENLDRSQRQVISEARFTRRGKKLVLLLKPYGEAGIELKSIEECIPSFEKVFGKAFWIDAGDGAAGMI